MRSPTLTSIHSSALLDLINHIEIQLELPIRHIHYPSSEIAPDIEIQFQKMSPEMRQDYLIFHTRDYLYDIYYSGELQPLLPEIVAPTAVLKNDKVQGVNAAFYAQVRQANYGTGYFDDGWQVIQHKPDGRLLVQKEGLRVKIEPNRHLLAAVSLPLPGETVSIRLPHNRLETGYYVAVGNVGMPAADQPVLELCLNLSSEGAIAAMHTVTSILNLHAIPFTFKVLMNPTCYQRRDAGVLHLEQRHYETVHPLLGQIYEHVRSHLQPETPLFTKPLAPGLGLAEEPEDGQDFGLYRCHLVAESLLRVEEGGDRSPAARLAAIHENFQAEGLDLQRPYLNAKSQDIYTPLECAL